MPDTNRVNSVRVGLGHDTHRLGPGEALVLGSMAEAYSRLQRRLRAEFPDRAVVWLNLVNGSIGYLPPAERYDVDVYPVWQTPFDRGSLERVEEAAVTLGHHLLASG